MVQFLIDNMAPIMFASLMAIILLGYPIAFSLAALGLFYGVIGIELGLFTPNFLQALPDRVFDIMSNETLLAIPFFTFMGFVLDRSKMAEELLRTMGELFGSVRGGLAYTVIFVGALLAATTGVVAASVISMGLISLPLMLRYAYDRGLAAGVIMAAATLAQILPPSLVLIVLADQLRISVGDIYIGALVPAFVLISLFASYVLVLSIIWPGKTPPLPEGNHSAGEFKSLLVGLVPTIFVAYFATYLIEPHVEQAAYVYGGLIAVLFLFACVMISRLLGLGAFSNLAEKIVFSLVPPLVLIFLVLGTIFIGLATPTEAGAMGAAGALALTLAKGRLTFTLTRDAVESTLKLSAFVMFILIGARVFALVFYGVGGHIWVKDLLLALPGGEAGFIAFVGTIIFLLGFFLDFFEIVFILVPLLIAPAQALGIDMVWLGVILALILQTSFLTPPFGFTLFFFRSVAPTDDYVDEPTGRTIKGVKTSEIYRAAVPFVILHIIAAAIVFFIPQTVTHYRTTDFVDPDIVQEQLDNIDFPDFGDDDLLPPLFD